ncbi:uncharacterized protein C3orf14 homolog isoform X2 [Hippoglossus stenolepis]|uniref:uncharacterized protein C3orf14 homolog isoform X2 n=1 Tax=Hippoglossus stenolepis TaxID=195615 RepID=UPI00159C26E2|nr:uncharacterized protein C3orf14 homolog isoform X2 [Hippoglossus stenolepis]
MDLLEKHEDILGKRAELLEEMGSRREQLNILRRQQVEEREAARHRNATLLQVRTPHTGAPPSHLSSLCLSFTDISFTSLPGLTEDRGWSSRGEADTPKSPGFGDKVLGVCGRVHPSLGALPFG